ncbi:MAG: molybdopterin-guanine dinucleotide biosynthesis protein B, partial [Desulfobacteraceae bacterium]
MTRYSERYSNSLDQGAHPPVVSVAGFSGAGKTRLIAQLIPVLRSLGLSVGTIKHHRHSFDMDTPGKDSWVHRKAGAAGTVLSSPTAIGLIRNVEHD